MKSGTSHVALLALLTLACTDEDPAQDDSGTGDTESGEEEAGLTGEDELGTGDGGSDDATDEATDTGGDGDCPLGEYIPMSFTDTPDWSNVSGSIHHTVSHSWLNPPSQSVHAVFYTSDLIDDSRLCVERIVESAGVDSCTVWYTDGQGLGGDPGDPLNPWFEDLEVNTVVFDVGEGPVVLEGFMNEGNPTQYTASLPPPPDGVPYGGMATLAATFANLPALEVGLDVPAAIMPIGYPVETTTLSSEELASWTWTTPGGAAPIELRIRLAATPGGYSSWVQIECAVADDGEFAFPVEYLDLARERLGPELHANTKITRTAVGTEVLADKDLHWRSSVEALLSVSVTD